MDDYYDEDEFEEMEAIEQHCGDLAGLSFAERERCIEDYLIEEDGSFTERLLELLDEECLEGEPTGSLVDLLESENFQDVRRFAGYLGLRDLRTMRDDELFAAIAERVGDASAVQPIVGELSAHHIRALRELAERGGRWEVDEDDVVSLRDLPMYELGLSYVFRGEEGYTFVMPDEVLAIADQIDWDGAIEQAQTYSDLIGRIDDIVELRGIVPLSEAIDEYRRCRPDGIDSMRDIVALVLQGVAEGTASFELLEVPSREMYALHYELFWAYQEVMGLEDSEYVSEPVTHGELGEFLEGLIDQQQGIPPRPLSDDMLAEQSVLAWKMKQQPVWEFCQYLDAHVPDTQDDYYFADKVLEELVIDAKWGLMDQGTQRLFDILEANDFIPEADQVQDILDLWVGLCNGLPNWPNNGWSPDELAQLIAQARAAAEGIE